MSKVSRRIGVALTLSAVAVASCGGPVLPTDPSRVPATPIGRIVVLGDSLAVSPAIAESFPARLQGLLDAAGYRWTISNAGVWGDTTSDGLARFATAVPAGTNILVLELGANDGLRGDDVATMERNLAQIMERAGGMRIQVLLCGMETPPFHGLDYSVRFHQVFGRLAARYTVPLVPFLLQGVLLDPDLNGADGIHPNAAGARRIAETVWRYLEPLVRTGTRAVMVDPSCQLCLDLPHVEPTRPGRLTRDPDDLLRLRNQPRTTNTGCHNRWGRAATQRHPTASLDRDQRWLGVQHHAGNGDRLRAV